MKTVFIISEYNPFHKGHSYQIRRIREELAPDNVVSIMSGHFVQRGAPAILDKFNRARLALAGGCDLVVELPAVYATSSAEFFARGGVAIAQGLDPAGTLSFGSESGNLTQIETVARLLTENKESMEVHLKELLAQGLTYPRARALALSQLSGSPGLESAMESPNDILAVEYVRAAQEMGSSLNFHTIRRQGLGYHATSLETGQFPSATALRQALLAGNTGQTLAGLPAEVAALFAGLSDELLLDEDRLKLILRYRLSLFPQAIESLPEARNGVGERIANQAPLLNDQSIQDFALAMKTRRLTYTRIRRLLLHLALGFDSLNYDQRRRQLPSYTRILALNRQGARFLAQTRKTRTIQAIQSATEVSEADFLPDLMAARLYSLLSPTLAPNSDYTHPLRIQD